MDTRAALAYARASRRRALAELCELLRFPSVSARPAGDAGVAGCARWLAAHLRRIGLRRVALIRTPRHPAVYAEWLGAPGRPTLLIYGHYDVQPTAPDSEWRTPPFAPTIRGPYLYARGASDDKGQLFCQLKAIEACLRAAGRLPLNLRILLDGEEEIGSPSLPALLRDRRADLAADAAVISDTRFLAPGRPALTYALRGGLGLELELRTLRQDVHSGSFGGAVLNPIQALAELLARLHDERGRVALPGFYERVRDWGPAERRRMARDGPADEQILRDAGAARAWGEPGFSLYERTTIRPSLTISGIAGGHQGPGVKGVIPARATAKLSLRLVPGQEPAEVERLLRRELERLTPPGASLRITAQQRTRPALVRRGHPVMRAAAEAYRRGFGAAPALLRSGGSIPVVSMFAEQLGLTTALLGFALPDDRMHGPNERFHLGQLFAGIDTCIHFMDLLGRGVPGDKALAQRAEAE